MIFEILFKMVIPIITGCLRPTIAIRPDITFWGVNVSCFYTFIEVVTEIISQLFIRLNFSECLVF